MVVESLVVNWLCHGCTSFAGTSASLDPPERVVKGEDVSRYGRYVICIKPKMSVCCLFFMHGHSF